MRGLRRWAGYAALNRPLTILGVERRGFLLIATLGLAMWNAMASLVTGGVVFAVGYGAGWLAGLNLSAKVSTAIESCTGLAIENVTLYGGDEPLVRRFLLSSCSLSLRG